MDDEHIDALFDTISQTHDKRALAGRLAAECGNLVYELAKALELPVWPRRLDYGLLGAIVSVSLCLEQITHSVLSDVERVKIKHIRTARLVRMRQSTRSPSGF